MIKITGTEKELFELKNIIARGLVSNNLSDGQRMYFLSDIMYEPILSKERQKHIFIINGAAGSGKDTFVDFVKKYALVVNCSSVDRVKAIARMCGWNGAKNDRDRKFLSDLKQLTLEYSDLPFKAMEEEVEKFKDQKDLHTILFLHIREIDQIERAKKEFGATTIGFKRKGIEVCESNQSDLNVYNYDYDLYIDNDGSLDDLEDIAKRFAKYNYLLDQNISELQEKIKLEFKEKG